MIRINGGPNEAQSSSRIIGGGRIHSLRALFARLPAFPVPAVLLARLAVHRAVQGQGLGTWLFDETKIQDPRIKDRKALFTASSVG
jgi:predicted N-acetyltransferase YhbS